MRSAQSVFALVLFSLTCSTAADGRKATRIPSIARFVEADGSASISHRVEADGSKRLIRQRRRVVAIAADGSMAQHDADEPKVPGLIEMSGVTSLAEEKVEHISTHVMSRRVLARSASVGAALGGGVLVCCLCCCFCCFIFRSELSKNMREPGEGWMGQLAISMMDNEGNKTSSEDMVERAGISAEQVVVELGPGNGHFLQKAAAKGCKKLYGVEISAAFRVHLLNKLAGLEPAIDIRADDAKSMQFLQDASVDCVLGMNVVYFLQPLLEYLAEFHRVLKPSGSLFWGCKFEAAKMQDSSVAKNNAQAPIIEAMEAAGFRVRTEQVDFGGTSKGDYLAIIGSKTDTGSAKTSPARYDIGEAGDLQADQG